MSKTNSPSFQYLENQGRESLSGLLDEQFSPQSVLALIAKLQEWSAFPARIDRERTRSELEKLSRRDLVNTALHLFDEKYKVLSVLSPMVRAINAEIHGSGQGRIDGLPIFPGDERTSP